ncbi:tetratricopeptide repeat protein [Megasphaera stantonii]|uniref:tetratricopeptide repeat protein n=1 Tax=Megasphaera stantonii TaxID=2144175 RepID=UPI002943161D|nr:tetratricopeptide repeat protein [Megasphaera stantonii]
MSLNFKLDGDDEFIKGLELLQSNEPFHLRKAFSHFCAAAEKGHIEAIFQVGYLCMYGGFEIARNDLKAVECFKKAADEGIVAAKFYLAICYLYSLGIEENREAAIKLFEESFHSGWIWSADWLSDIYRLGMGVPVNRDKALEYIQYARQAGLPNAELKYLHCLALPKEGERN